ncbi:F0F1 ATP synthase subunit epsilon [Granulicatella seriolae]|uniref:ATP synthase epsilon chain n=1 Tax=Granulicatella seriolae TaxID=2967226 RepID=A0ABT1WMA6_9LACT|nr:F0F1 ATP synthase subunit epsilon [Granulicatella seriolae]
MLDHHELMVVVTTPEGKVYNHRSYSVSVETLDGGLTILPNHAPIMVPLKIGALKVKRFLDDSPTDFIAIGGGVMEVRDNVVTILANVAERARDIDIERAEHAKAEAESALKKENATKNEMDRAKLALSKAINRIGVSKHRRY